MNRVTQEMFPLLADHVRLQPLVDYVKVLNVRTGENRHLSRREAIPLEMARGDRSLQEIVRTVGEVYSLSESQAGSLVEAVFDLYRDEVEWSKVTTPIRTISDPERLFSMDGRIRPPAPLRQDRPSQLKLSVTLACNYRCGHCCNRSGERMARELTCEEWLQIIREAGKLEVLSVTFSGGEPLIRPDLPALIAEASSVGIYSVLSTNASLIDRNIARELACAGLRFAHVSLCAADADMYGRLTGSHNKFAAALNGLRHLKGQDIYVRLKTVLMPGNLDQIGGVLDLAMNEGVDEVHLAPYRMTHLSPGGSSLLLRRNDFWQIQAKVDQWKKQTNSNMPIRVPDPEKEKLAWDGAGEIVRCGGIKAEMTVLPDGRITLCEVLRDRPEFIVGHALRDGILGAWLSRRPEEVLEDIVEKAEEPCGSCSHLSGCRTGCFALSLACGGDPWSADPRCWKSSYPGNPFLGL